MFQASPLFKLIFLPSPLDYVYNIQLTTIHGVLLNQQAAVTQHIKNWLKDIIIKLNFCPFANREFISNSIRYSVSQSTELESGLHALAEEFNHLDQHPKTETTLLIFPNSFTVFNDFLELIDYANQLLKELGYESTYQLAHFHPDYCFEGVQADDASNYTNRSPYPILHIIREESLQKAIENHPDAGGIPDTNIMLARKLGSAKMQFLLNQCKHSRQGT